jgi:hypothetical protein
MRGTPPTLETMMSWKFVQSCPAGMGLHPPLPPETLHWPPWLAAELLKPQKDEMETMTELVERCLQLKRMASMAMGHPGPMLPFKGVIMIWLTPAVCDRTGERPEPPQRRSERQAARRIEDERKRGEPLRVSGTLFFSLRFFSKSIMFPLTRIRSAARHLDDRSNKTKIDLRRG